MRKGPQDLTNSQARKKSILEARLVYLFLWLLALIGLFIPITYFPTPYNGSASYFSVWGSISPWSGIGSPYPFSAFFYCLGLFFGVVALFKSWESCGLMILSGSLMIIGIAVLLSTLTIFSQLDCNPCYYPSIDVGLLVVLAVQVLYIVGGLRLRE